MTDPGLEYSFIVPRSRYVTSDPLHFAIERHVQYPYILRFYLFVEKITKDGHKKVRDLIQITPNTTDDHFAQYPENESLISQDFVLAVWKDGVTPKKLNEYQVVLNDRLIYTKAMIALGHENQDDYTDCNIEIQIGEFNLDTQSWESVQMAGILTYQKSGSLFGVR